MFFTFKIILSGLIIAYASWLSGRKPVLAGFLIAMPMMSMLSILFSYIEYRDITKVNQFAISILTAVPLSLTFFLPFLINKWIKMNFTVTYLAGLSCVLIAFWIHHFLFKH